MDIVKDVNEFLCHVRLDRSYIKDQRQALRVRYEILLEEARELKLALDEDDLIGVADALVDVVYIAIGTALLLGIPFAACWDEVHASNMTKSPVTNDDNTDGKNRGYNNAVKGAGYREPNLRRAWLEGSNEIT
jgi:predicted HAD superfamily Cof-like phosphohydrolase